MRTLIVGGRGFIGSELRRQIPADILDLKDGNDARGIKGKYDLIYHLGANLSPENDDDIEMHRAVVENAMRNGSYIVYTSSASVYDPISLYGVQKLYGEILVKTVPHTILRLFNVYGGGTGIMDKIKNGEDIAITGNGTQTRDFVHVDDVVSALLTAPNFSGIHDIGTGRETAINSLVKNPVYNGGNPGILRSRATLDPLFPWYPKHV